MLYEFESLVNGSAPSIIPRPVKLLAHLCFDRDIAVKAGIPAAIIAKYVECSVRKKVMNFPETQGWVFKTQAQLAGELGMTLKQVRLATAKLKELGVLKTTKKFKSRCRHVLSYGFCEQDAFFASRAKAKRINFQPAEASKWGYCAAIVLNSLRFWVSQNAETASHCFEGLVWHYDSLDGLAKVYDGMFTKRQVKAAVLNLVKEKVLLRRAYSQTNKFDSRRWYALAESRCSASEGATLLPGPVLKVDCETVDAKGQIVGPERTNQRAQKGKSLLCNPFSYDTSTRWRSSQNLNPRNNLTLCKGPEDLRQSLFLKPAKLLPANHDLSRDPLPATESTREAPCTKIDLIASSGRETNGVCTVRQVYRDAYQEVFGILPPDGLGKARFVLKCAVHLKLSVKCFIMLRMQAWRQTHPDDPFYSKLLTTSASYFAVESYKACLIKKYATTGEGYVGMLFNERRNQTLKTMTVTNRPGSPAPLISKRCIGLCNRIK